MTKRNFLKLLALFSLAFLFLQFVLYKTVYRQSFDYSKQKYTVTNVDKLRILQTFLLKAEEINLDIFLIEPSILLSVVTNKSLYNDPCLHLCHSENLITFGLHGNKDTQAFFISDFVAKGFTVIETYVKKTVLLPPHLSSNEQLPSHFFLFKDGLILHLVVFYTRGDNFVWSSRVLFENGERPPWLKINKLMFGKLRASVFNSINIEQILVDNQKISVPVHIEKFLDEYQTSSFIECNHKRAELFYKKFPKDTSPAALHFQKKGRQLLSKAKTILDKMDVPFWLSSGTCLGWFRQCNIIPHSKDVDLGIWITDYKEGMTEAFEDDGFVLKHSFGQKNDSFELSYRLGEVKLDIFFFYKEDEYFWNGGTHAWTGEKYKYIFPKFTICWTVLLELKVRVPCESQAYIEANYGENWFTPVKDWQWNKSPPNVQKNGMWPTRDWDRVIQVYD